MLRVPVQQIEPGMVLARPVRMPRQPQRCLLSRGREIPMDLVPRLMALGIFEVWIRYRPLEILNGLDDKGLDDEESARIDAYVHIRDFLQQVMVGTTAEVELPRFERAVQEMLESLRRNPEGHAALDRLDAFDHGLLGHSARVCFLSLALGLKLQRYLASEQPDKPPGEAVDYGELALGSLLHDVGKMRVPRQVLFKPDRLSPEEMAIVRMHPVYGFEMVRSWMPPAAADVVLHHHQRYDGTGYPRYTDSLTGATTAPLRGKEISIFSRIAAIADVYDAATSPRCYSAAKLPVHVLHEMRTVCRGAFDPRVERAFYELIPPFPVGQLVTLSDDTDAVVIDYNSRAPERPRVQRIRYDDGTQVSDPSREEIDLSATADFLEIASIGGVDVRPYLTRRSRRGREALAPA